MGTEPELENNGSHAFYAVISKCFIAKMTHLEHNIFIVKCYIYSNISFCSLIYTTLLTVKEN